MFTGPKFQNREFIFGKITSKPKSNSSSVSIEISSSNDKTASVSISLYGKNRFDNLFSFVRIIFSCLLIRGHCDAIKESKQINYLYIYF